MDTVPAIVVTKNDWLHNQVEVDYPTKESLKGCELYFSRYNNAVVYALDEIEGAVTMSADDIFVVDFHRLTVMFSLLQAKRWPSQDDQDLILEFLSQIIYSSPCELYLAFADGAPVAAALVTKTEDGCLISDVSCDSQVNINDFVMSLSAKLQAQGIQVTDVEL
ncbi:flavodoxin [Vibrio agarivorans]|uniref:flavodoxin n=1 Tax=Vibrio agarivorans TaxID=153622 RepID=UPI0025B2914D|nr:flavodoxin [Vibrio agarivorans]MDN3660082.1 flavodoxin [Vibrio agarivorans]